MAPEMSSQTEVPVQPSVSPLSSSREPTSREPTPLVQPPQRASQQPMNNNYNNVQNPYGLYPQSYGSHYVPYDQTAPQQLRQMQQVQYQQQQNGQQVTYMTVPFEQPRETNHRLITKDVLHVLVLIMTIIGIGFSFSLIGTGINDNGRSNSSYYYYGDFDNYIPAVSAGPIFIIALLWSLAELIVRCSRNWKSGIHPGAHVGVCLCIWLGAVIVGAILTAFLTEGYYYNSCSSGSSTSYSGRACARSQNAMYIGSTVLVFLVAVAEIVIFIIACTDTHVRNKWKRNVVIASTPYWAPPPQGWGVAPGQQMHQQMPQQMPQHMPQHMPQQMSQQQFMPMGQAPMNQVPMTQVQQPMMANTRAAPTHAGSHPVAAQKEVPVQPEHTVKEFYTPGTAQ